MGAGVVQVPPDSTGKKIDCASVTAGGQTVYRQAVVVADPTASAGYAAVANNALNVNVMNISGGLVLAAGTNQIGYLQKISATVGITGTVQLVAGTANFGTLNDISKTVAVIIATGTNNIGAVSLAAGTANIGFINNISATVTVVNSGFFDSSAGSTTLVRVGDSANSAVRVNVVAGASGSSLVSITGTATVVIGAGTQNIGTVGISSGTLAMSGTLDGISSTVMVAGAVAVNASITAGNNPVLMGGRVKTSASTTATAHSATFLWLDKNGRSVTIKNNPSLPPSATHGPKYCGAISASGGATLIAAPGAGKSIFIDHIQWSNLNASTGTILFIYEGSATATPLLVTWVPSNSSHPGVKYDPPARISSNAALSGKVKPNVDGVLINVHFYVGVD